MKLPFIVQSRPFIGILFLIKRKVYSITIKRERAFWEKAEVFATNADYETVVSEISRMDFSEIKAGVYPNVNGERVVL